MMKSAADKSGWRPVAWASKALAAALVAATTVGVAAWAGRGRAEDVDSGCYRAMARGEAVVAPYSKRVVHPWIVGCAAKTIAACSGAAPRQADYEAAAKALSLATLALAAIAWVELMWKRLKHWQVVATAACPVWWVSYLNTWLPDLFVFALSAWFILALDKGWLKTALAFLAALVVTRETSLLLSLFWIAGSLLNRKHRMAAAVAASTVAALAASAWLTRGAGTNIHGFSGPVYLVSKSVANGLANLCGVIVWNDVYARVLPHFYPNAPAASWTLPGWIPSGSVTKVGMYEWTPSLVAATLKAMLLTFGLWGWSALAEGMRGLKRFFSRRAAKDLDNPGGLATGESGIPAEKWLFWAGLAFWALTPFEGRSVTRLVCYAWPAMMAAAPVIAGAKDRKWLWAVHVALCLAQI